MTPTTSDRGIEASQELPADVLSEGDLHNVAAQVRGEQMKLLHSSMIRGAIGTLINATVVAVVLWNQLSRLALILWWSSNVVVGLLSLVMVRLFQRKERSSEDIEVWRRRLFYRMILAGLVFGALGAFFTARVPLLYHVFYFLILGGMMAASSAIYSVRLEMYLGYSIPASVPMLVRILSYGDTMAIVMGLVAVFFLLVVFSSVRGINQVTNAALDLRFRNEDLVSKLSQARDHLWGEMQLAHRIQTVLLPEKTAVSGYEIAAYMEPADQVGGDYYDVINVADRDWLVIGDVSGHGVPAGLVMMMVQTSIQTVLERAPDLKPSELLTSVNAVITSNIQRLHDDKYMTLTVLAVGQDGAFCFSGLHQDILIHRAASSTVERVPSAGVWIGLVDDVTGMLDDDVLEMRPGDTMLLYTDGITEATREPAPEKAADASSRLYGIDQLIRLLGEHGARSPQELIDVLRSSLRGYRVNDDVTLMVIQRR